MKFYATVLDTPTETQSGEKQKFTAEEADEWINRNPGWEKEPAGNSKTKFYVFTNV